MKKIKIIARDPICNFFEGRMFNDKELEFFDAISEDIIEVEDKQSLQQAIKLYEQKKPSVRKFDLEVSVI